MKQIKLTLLMLLGLSLNLVQAQSPALGVTGFNNPTFDQTPFASGSGLPNELIATNVANTFWNVHIGGTGFYTITQVDYSTTSTYNGGIVATNATPVGTPNIYQTFSIYTPSLTKFKLNSIKVKVDNNSALPIAMVLAGMSSPSAGTPLPFIAPPGSNWITINTSANVGFSNIVGVVTINQTGTLSVAEIGYDDIDISAPVTNVVTPTFTHHPLSQSTCVGGTTSFTATATNAATYFWIASTDGLTWNPINSSTAGIFFTGYNTNVLTVSNASLLINNLYLAASAVSASGGNQASNVARLYVTPVPSAGIISGPNTLCVGSIANFSSTLPGGIWSTTGRASINASTGAATGTSGGATSVIYKLGTGICAATSTKALTVNVLPAIPTITYAAGNLVNPQLGGTGGAYCANRTFNVAGIPAGGAWSSTGSISVTSAGIATTANVLSGLVSGSLSYTFTNSISGCSSKRTITGNVMKCTPKGVNSNSNSTEQSNFSVFPNPTKGAIKLNLNYVEKGTTATVFNMLGKQVKTQNLSIGNNSIDVSNLAKGLYIVNVTSNNKTTSQKVVIE